MNTSLVEKALVFAQQAHAGQTRKYTGEPYVQHPIAVAAIVRTVPHNDYMIAAALLHDTVEDTDVTREDILREFGSVVEIFVDGLTDVSKPEDGNRKTREDLDRAHLAKGLPPIQTIKLADMIHNSISSEEHDPDFAKVYMKEFELLLDVLTNGDPELHKRATDVVYDYNMKRALEK